MNSAALHNMILQLNFADAITSKLPASPATDRLLRAAGAEAISSAPTPARRNAAQLLLELKEADLGIFYPKESEPRRIMTTLAKKEKLLKALEAMVSSIAAPSPEPSVLQSLAAFEQRLSVLNAVLIRELGPTSCEALRESLEEQKDILSSSLRESDSYCKRLVQRFGEERCRQRVEMIRAQVERRRKYSEAIDKSLRELL